MLKSQKGVATLAIAGLLVLLAGLAVLTASKGIFFGQKTANNSYHRAQAYAAAQAGIEKGLSYLTNTSATVPNRKSLYDTSTKALVAKGLPIVESFASSKSGFTVTMSQPDADNPFQILITSTGCADGCLGCSTDCPRSVTLNQLVRFRALVVNEPIDAALVRGGIDINGTPKTINLDNSTGKGRGAHSGKSTVDAQGASIVGGTTDNQAVLANTTLPDIFKYYFGDVEDVKANTTNLSGALPPSGSEGEGYYVEGDAFGSGQETLGSPEKPIILIVNGNLKLVGQSTIYGIVYVAGDLEMAGGAAITGAAIVGGKLWMRGDSNISKNKSVISILKGTLPGTPAKIIGSWKDF